MKYKSLLFSASLIVVIVSSIAWTCNVIAETHSELATATQSRSTIDTQPPSRAQYAVQVTIPDRNGADVVERMDVKGTATIPIGDHLWVLVHHNDFKTVWWPQGEGGIDPKTGNWKVRVTFGQPRDVGDEFELAIITVDEREHRQLQSWFEEAMRTNNWDRPIKMPETTSAPIIRRVRKAP